MTRRPWWRAICGILLSLIFIPLLVVQVDLAQLWALLQSVRYAFLLPAVAALTLAHLLRAWLWQYIMAPLKRLPFRSLPSALSIGAMANMLLPAHAGEVIRAYALARKEHISILSCLATIVTERLADLLSLVFLVVVVLLSMDLSAQHPALGTRLRPGGYVIGSLGVFLGCGLWLLATATFFFPYIVLVGGFLWWERLSLQDLWAMRQPGRSD
jgi:glycosyltransferase 2 family protein